MKAKKKILTAMIVVSIAMVAMIQLATPTSADEPKRGDILIMHHPTMGWWSLGYWRHCALCKYWISDENNEFIHTSTYVENTTTGDLENAGWKDYVDAFTYLRVRYNNEKDVSGRDIERAIEHADKQLGEPYVHGSPCHVIREFRRKDVGTSGVDEWYCSELMWAAYRVGTYGKVNLDSDTCPWWLCGNGASPDEIWDDWNTYLVVGPGVE